MGWDGGLRRAPIGVNLTERADSADTSVFKIFVSRARLLKLHGYTPTTSAAVQTLQALRDSLVGLLIDANGLEANDAVKLLTISGGTLVRAVSYDSLLTLPGL